MWHHSSAACRERERETERVSACMCAWWVGGGLGGCWHGKKPLGEISCTVHSRSTAGSGSAQQEPTEQPACGYCKCCARCSAPVGHTVICTVVCTAVCSAVCSVHCSVHCRGCAGLPLWLPSLAGAFIDHRLPKAAHRAEARCSSSSAFQRSRARKVAGLGSSTAGPTTSRDTRLH